MDQDTRYALWLKKMGLVNSNMDRRYHFNEFDALRARLAAAEARVAELEGLLREWQEWEAKWVMTDEAWACGLPSLTQDLYDEYVMSLQDKREKLLDAALRGEEVQGS